MNNPILTFESLEFRLSKGNLTNFTQFEIFDVHMTDVIEEFGAGNILEEIGIEEAKAHFGLIEKE